MIGRGDIELQTANVFANVERVLNAPGARWCDVVKLNTYYVYKGAPEEAREFWEKMTAARLRFITDPGPVATAVRVPGLMYDGFLIEVEAIAVIGRRFEAWPMDLPAT